MTTVNAPGSLLDQELLAQARALVEQHGEVPSRNALMRQFGIGAAKASRLRDQLTTEVGNGPAQTPRRLRSVPESAEATEPALEPVPEPDDPVADAPKVFDRDDDAESVESVRAVRPLGGAAPSEPEPEPGAGPAAVADMAGPSLQPPVRSWPVLLLALPAFVAIWTGWVGLGELTGFGIVHPLPGIADGFAINTAITLPIGVEAYAAYALRVWLSGRVPARARRFARTSALCSLGLGALGQVAFHLMDAAGVTTAPWPITTLVACLPVAVLGMGAALTHLIHDSNVSEVSR